MKKLRNIVCKHAQLDEEDFGIRSPVYCDCSNKKAGIMINETAYCIINQMPRHILSGKVYLEGLDLSLMEDCRYNKK